MRLHRVAPAELSDLWPQIRERVAACCARSGGKYAPVDVLMHCLSRRMDLWLVVETDDRRESAARQSIRGESPRSADADRSAECAGLVWSAAHEAPKIKAIAITEIVAYPRITVCKLLACTGEGAEQWVDLLADIETWAKAQGCAVVEPICRPGWERRLKPQGYRKTHVVLEKSL